MTFSVRSLALGLAAGLALAAPARADLVVLSSGRVMSASSVVLTDDTATIRCAAAARSSAIERSSSASTRTRRRGSTRPAPAAGGPSAGRLRDADARRRRRSAAVEIPAAYRGIITRLAEAHGVDARLVHAVIAVESAYQPRARSPQGRARADAADAGDRAAVRRAQRLQGGGESRGRRPPPEVAARSLRRPLALAAYNAGEAAGPPLRRHAAVSARRATTSSVLSLAGLDAAEPPAAADRAGS